MLCSLSFIDNCCGFYINDRIITSGFGLCFKSESCNTFSRVSVLILTGVVSKGKRFQRISQNVHC